MVAQEVAGMLLMALAGMTESGLVVLSKVVKRMGRSYYLLLGLAQALLCIGLLVLIFCQRERPRLALWQLKWVWLRGLFGSLTMALALLSVAVGAPLGDASALTSFNVVVAALLGWAVLGEPLHPVHLAALGCSLLGAALISQPEALFGERGASSAGGVPWLGYLLALGSGLCSGSLFIASRKSQNVSPLIMTSSLAVHLAAACWIMALGHVVEDAGLESLVSAPLVAAGLLALIFVTGAANTISTSAGAQMCPAAASCTIFTSFQMTLGYVAQAVMDGEAPKALTMFGASLMLLAVVLMAAAGKMLPAKVPARDVAVEEAVAPRTLESGPSDQVLLA